MRNSLEKLYNVDGHNFALLDCLLGTQSMFNDNANIVASWAQQGHSPYFL